MAIVWNEAAFGKWYKMYKPGGGYTTYGRISIRHSKSPEISWGYDDNNQYPDFPMNEYRWRMENMVAKFGIAPDSRILVLGCAYGALLEAFLWWKMQSGIAQNTALAQLAGVDNSPFIQGNITSEANPLLQGKILNRSLLDGAGVAGMRNGLRNTAGGSEFFDWVITESVIESYTDSERPAFVSACESYQRNTGTTTQSLSHVIHAVFPLVGYTPWGGGEPVYHGWNPEEDGGAPNRTLSNWYFTRPQNSWISLEGNMPAVVGTD